MNTVYDPTLKANITLDESGRVRGVNHLDKYPEIQDLQGREAADAYIRDVADALVIAPDALKELQQRVSFFDPRPQDIAYRFDDEKGLFDSATYAYYQTYLNTPVWASGLTVTLKQAPARVVAATNTSAEEISAEIPSQEALDRYRRLFATAEKAARVPPQLRAALNDDADFDGAKLLDKILGEAATTSKSLDDRQAAPRLISGRFFVYRYDSDERADHPHAEPAPNDPEGVAAQDPDQPLHETPPTLPLPRVPETIEEGRWYVVAELVFRLPYEGSRMNWRMLVEVETDTILYLRALSSGGERAGLY